MIEKEIKSLIRVGYCCGEGPEFFLYKIQGIKGGEIIQSPSGEDFYFVYSFEQSPEPYLLNFRVNSSSPIIEPIEYDALFSVFSHSDKVNQSVLEDFIESTGIDLYEASENFEKYHHNQFAPIFSQILEEEARFERIKRGPLALLTDGKR